MSDSIVSKAKAARKPGEGVEPTLPDHLSDYSDLAPEHAQELYDSAIPAFVAAEQGVCTARTRDELPEWARWIADRHGDTVFPALVYPMVHPDGSETGQVKPAPGSVTDGEGRVLKYMSPGKDANPPKLPVLRAVDSPQKVLVVEGVKQSLSALAWAPENWSIYSITGIWSWSVAGDDGESGSPTPHLAVVQGEDVVIVPDADARTNPRVFDGAAALGTACDDYGANSVRFARLPAAGKSGLDDVLAGLGDDDARRRMLSTWVSRAKAKPADLTKAELEKLRARAARNDAEKRAGTSEGSDDRVQVNVGDDPLKAVHQFVGVLKEKRGGKTVFQRDAELVRVHRSRGVLQVNKLDVAKLHRELLEITCPIQASEKSVEHVTVPKPLLEVTADYWGVFPDLAGITRSPVVRSDGRILTENGYDEQTGLVLDLSEDVVGIDVPDHPTDADIAAARTLIRDEFLAMDGAGGYDGWVFQEVADQTNAAAALITPVVRSFTDAAPGFLGNGIQPGVGKGALVNAIHQVAFGEEASMQTAPDTDAEMDKRITAYLFDGADAITLDEVQESEEDGGRCRLKSASLRTALTATTYSGRELSKTRMLNLPNLATWFLLGNNVQTPADMARRVVPIRLSSDRPDLENRDNFRHDLSTWVPENRRRILRAVLVLVSAWFDRGQPEAPRDFGFASFTEWQRIVGGILHLAGFEDFLGNVMEVRQAIDTEAVHNREHWEWVESLFPAGTRWPVRDVIAQAKADPDAPPPHGLSWEGVDSRRLSMYYGQHPRWYGDLRIRRDGDLHGGVKAYVVERLTAAAPLPAAGPSGDGGAPSAAEDGSAPAPAAPAELRHAGGAAPGEAIEFTDRNGFTQRVARAMPPMNGRTIAELGQEAS